MNAIHEEIWLLALPYLRKGSRKDFVLHTRTVLSALESLLQYEKGDRRVLIPAAILHDTGWANVPVELQQTREKHLVRKAMVLHLERSVPIVREILKAVRFDAKEARRIRDIILSHKFRNPRNPDKRLLIDADTLSDVFKEQFYSDARMFGVSPRDFFRIRMENRFYTRTAGKIFRRELKKRADEIGLSA